MDRKIPWSVKVPQTPSAFTLLPTAAVLAAPVVGSAYPTSPVPTRINGESLEFRDEHVQFASPYSQTWLYSGQDDFRRIVLAYVRIPPADRDTLRAHWKTVKGLVGRFSFAHPVSGESRTMRYARPALEWDEDPEPGYWAGAPIHSLEIELVDAP
jgi:hypothetical protein